MWIHLLRQRLFKMCCCALERAYIASKRVRNIQRDFMYYKATPIYTRSWYNVSMYMNFALHKASLDIYWALVECKIINCVLRILNTDPFSNANSFNQDTTSSYSDESISSDNSNKHIAKPQGIYNRNWYQTKVIMQHKPIFISKPNHDVKKLHQVDNPINVNSVSTKCVSRYVLDMINFSYFNRKITWIEATLLDLEIAKRQCWVYNTVGCLNLLKSSNILSLLEPKSRAYEFIGLIPQSITHSLIRFKTELVANYNAFMLIEFRLAKYLAVSSLQYMAWLLLLPWLLCNVCKLIILQPLAAYWWNTDQFQVFTNISQEQHAFRHLQEIEELLWLDIVISDASHKSPQAFSAQVHEKTLELIEIYNHHSIDTVVHLCTNVIFLIILVLLIILSKQRISILISWIQELFYSLSDTMKAFIILLLTDLSIGFHSPHGWELLISWLLKHVGFSYNKQVISCFVSTFPVILNTILKYWIFRHLNRISPSIVVTYHTMNE